MTIKERYETLTNDEKLLVIEFLKARDKQWIEQLSASNPTEWQLSDYEKSERMFDELAEKVKANSKP